LVSSYVYLSVIHFISPTVNSPLQVKAFTPLTILETTTHVFWGQQQLRHGNCIGETTNYCATNTPTLGV
jgi:hypothetical protein